MFLFFIFVLASIFAAGLLLTLPVLLAMLLIVVLAGMTDRLTLAIMRRNERKKGPE